MSWCWLKVSQLDSSYLRKLTLPEATACLLDRTTGRLRFGWSHTTLKRRSPFDGSVGVVGTKNSDSTWEDWGYLSSESRKWPVRPYLSDGRNLGTIRIGQSDSHTRLGVDDEGRERAKGTPFVLDHSVGATCGIPLRQRITKNGHSQVTSLRWLHTWHGLNIFRLYFISLSALDSLYLYHSTWKTPYIVSIFKRLE